MSALTDSIDQRLGERFSDILAAQSAFFAAHGVYCQLVPTHSQIPADGEFVAPDRAGEAVSDVGIKWTDLGQLPATMQSCLEIHIYGGPQGNGFVVIAQVIENGVLMEKRVNVGPESYRAHNWREINL